MLKCAKPLLTDRSGGTAATFAVVLPVIALVAVMSVELTLAGNARHDLQQVLDSAVLAAATTDAETDGELTTAVTSYVHAAWKKRPAGVTVGITASRDDDTGVISAVAAFNLPTLAASLMGESATAIKVRSDAIAGVTQNLELALVLDTTGSMDGAKIDLLKVVAKEMVDLLMVEESVKVAVVPFAELVNVGVANRNKPWIDVPPDVPASTVCGDHTEMVGETCTQVPDTCTYEGSTYACTRRVCTGGTPTTVYRCVDHPEQKWVGCVGSREAPRNAQDSHYTNRIPGLITPWCPTPIQTLTNNQSAVEAAINALVAQSETYMPIGLIWGWRVLSKIAPFSEGLPDSDIGKKARKTIVFMTDGMNTRSKDPSSPWSSGSDVAAANALFADICSNIKAAGVEIFTIGFQVPDATAEAMVRTCATDAHHAFNADNNAQLKAAFDKIARDLRDVRLTR